MKKHYFMLFLIIGVLLSQIGLLTAQDRVVESQYESIRDRTEFRPLFSKPGGVVIGPSLERGFHYGGRCAGRTSDGILHVTWEDPSYMFHYYAHSLDTLGLSWTTPINPMDATGYFVTRARMAKLSIDEQTDDIYMISYYYENPGDLYKLAITRSTDGGATWCTYMDMGAKIGVTTENVEWSTITIDTKRIMHIAWTRASQDIMYSKIDLSVADGQPDLSACQVVKSDGTVGSEPISFVPSGVVFQGTIVLDRNEDPHIIFSGDGGGDTFGDKTPYHIYYKSAASAWGPIPPTRLWAELEVMWGMPEMIFDKNNRGYYFMDHNPGTLSFGTWEPPADPNSATDFGTLNNGEGFEGSVQLIDENFANLPITDDDLLYLPNADVDDEKDIVYLVANTNGYSDGNGGDIVALKLENATSYTGQGPSTMDWELHRYITTDGIALGDVGPDVVYDPSSSKLDIFWSGSGATGNVAQYINGTAKIPAVDASPLALDIGDDVNNPFNKNEEIVVLGSIKNNGTDPLGPVATTLSIQDSNGVEKYSKQLTTPPLLAGQTAAGLNFGSWVIDGDKQAYSVILTTNYPGDEATYNDQVATSFYAYPDPDVCSYVEDFQDTTYTGFNTYDATGLFIVGNIDGWSVFDSSNVDTFDYVTTWILNDEFEDDYGAYLRHMMGIRNDTLYGDMPTGTPPQPQNEVLFSPVFDVSNVSGSLALEYESNIDGTDGDDNFPIYAFVDLTVDGGATWQTIIHRQKTVGGTGEKFDFIDKTFWSYDLTATIAGASTIQFRWWWRNMNNSSEFATWSVDDVYLVGLGAQMITDVNERVVVRPDGYLLKQNYPNPFNPDTEIEYSVEKTGHVELSVYNVNGQEVARLINGTVMAGKHRVRFDAKTLPSGIYFYKLKADGFEKIKKMTLLK